MLILERSDAPLGASERSGWRPWRLRRAPSPHPAGYGGLWVIEDEGHISTLAVQPSERGQRWGELLLTALIQRALTAGASYIVLEVRVSNLIAQALYRKYSFAIVERRARYYADSEDAFHHAPGSGCAHHRPLPANARPRSGANLLSARACATTTPAPPGRKPPQRRAKTPAPPQIARAICAPPYRAHTDAQGNVGRSPAPRAQTV